VVVVVVESASSAGGGDSNDDGAESGDERCVMLELEPADRIRTGEDDACETDSDDEPAAVAAAAAEDAVVNEVESLRVRVLDIKIKEKYVSK